MFCGGRYGGLHDMANQEDIARAQPPQRAMAVAVEQANFYPKGKPKENYKVENSTLNDVAEGQGVGRNLIAWTKTVWDAAGVKWLRYSPSRSIRSSHILITFPITSSKARFVPSCCSITSFGKAAIVVPVSPRRVVAPMRPNPVAPR